MRDENYYANKGTKLGFKTKYGYTAYEPNRGTPPSSSTQRRLRVQEIMGLSPLRKEVLKDGAIIHPTKGFRRALIGDQTARVTESQVREIEAARRESAPRVVRDAFSRVVESLTGWQRKRWSGAGYPGLVGRDASKVQPFAEMARVEWTPVAF